MALPSIFDLCTPRDDVRAGNISESDFAADLAQVLRSEGSLEYRDPAKFFEFSYPTKGLRTLLTQVCYRLSGDPRQVSSIFRLHTSFGGGKTHGLIALVHAVSSGSTVPNIAEFVDPAILPKGGVKVAGFEGENADALNGHAFPEHGIKAYTPWGELAIALAGKDGYERVRESDEKGSPPGADTIRELIGDTPCLILVDELAVYLRRARKKWLDIDESLASFLTSLFKAVESSPRAAIVFTLALGKNSSQSIDAYGKESETIASFFFEADSIAARKATLIDPTDDDETVKVLRRRLFATIDDGKATAVIDAYRAAWERHKSDLLQDEGAAIRAEQFAASYPLHPELMFVLTRKLSTLATFQRVRGMLRLLARTVHLLWKDEQDGIAAIHSWHIDPGDEGVTNELLVRLNQAQLVPAVKSDVASRDSSSQAWAQQTDAKEYAGMPRYASMVARTVFVHTLAFNPDLQGCKKPELYYSVLAPGIDLGYLQDAERRFVENSAYRDDRPNAPLRFLQDANLTMLIKREERNVDSGDARATLDDQIRQAFHGSTFEHIHFPSSPADVPDDATPAKPILAVLNYDACDIGADRNSIPELVRLIWQYKGASKDLRSGRNNLVFVIADHTRKEEMKSKARRKLALDALKLPDRIRSLPNHQQDKIRELAQSGVSELAVAVQQAYRHVVHPSNEQTEPGINLRHAVLDIPNTSANPGAGQKQVERYLHDLKRLYFSGDQPYSPLYIRDRTPLKKGKITTAGLRIEFYRDPALPMLVGDGPFVNLIRQGISENYFIYRRGDLVCGPGDPSVSIIIDEESWVYTSLQAEVDGIWPRKPPVIDDDIEDGDDKGNDNTGDGDTGGRDHKDPHGPITIDGKPLKECFAVLWEQTESKGVKALSRLDVSAFNEDAFNLMPQMAMLTGKKSIRIKTSWRTGSGGMCQIDFNGTLEEATPFKDFLIAILRTAKEKKVQLDYRIDYEGDGFSTTGEGPARMKESLTRLGLGALTATMKATPKN